MAINLDSRKIIAVVVIAIVVIAAIAIIAIPKNGGNDGPKTPKTVNTDSRYMYLKGDNVHFDIDEDKICVLKNDDSVTE